MGTSTASDDVGRRICDLVMKGGITSGIVFPAAIARLSKQYRFCNIGGTSAGAIAAAAAAAAEYRRCKDPDPASRNDGFESLARLPDYLAEKPEGGDHARLFCLFKPEAATAKHFEILAAMLNRPGVRSMVLHGALETIRRFRWGAILGAIPGAIVLYSACRSSAFAIVAALVGLALLVLGTVAGAACAAIRSLLKALPAQEFGLSRGYRARDDEGEGAKAPALVNWLHGYIQELAGKPVDDPLTFGDLEGAVVDKAAGADGIHLRMMTTALSMGRPYSLPLDRQDFYFQEEEFLRYFPREVVERMKNPRLEERRHPERDEAMAALGYLPLPAHEDLPVVVATRMSLSFPGLLCAVPLHRDAWETSVSRVGRRVSAIAPDEEAGPAREAAAVAEAPPRKREVHPQRVLFSDGGICSNFPIHMFDSVLPEWPTFGINLRGDLAQGEERAYLPARGSSLPPEHYEIAGNGAEGIASFVAAIVDTMQNWRDNLQRAAPGFRDRIVTVSHKPEEGGLNLDMREDAIRLMDDSGRLAAEDLVAAFATPARAQDDHWLYHRWVRVRSLLCVLQEGLDEVHHGITGATNSPPYPDLVLQAPGYVGRSYAMTEAERDKAHKLLDRLSALAGPALDEADFCRGAPRPRVELRIQPTF